MLKDLMMYTTIFGGGAQGASLENSCLEKGHFLDKGSKQLQVHRKLRAEKKGSMKLAR